MKDRRTISETVKIISVTAAILLMTMVQPSAVFAAEDSGNTEEIIEDIAAGDLTEEEAEFAEDAEEVLLADSGNTSESQNPNVVYCTHVQTYGWMGEKPKGRYQEQRASPNGLKP